MKKIAGLLVCDFEMNDTIVLCEDNVSTLFDLTDPGYGQPYGQLSTIVAYDDEEDDDWDDDDDENWD